MFWCIKRLDQHPSDAPQFHQSYYFWVLSGELWPLPNNTLSCLHLERNLLLPVSVVPDPALHLSPLMLWCRRTFPHFSPCYNSAGMPQHQAPCCQGHKSVSRLWTSPRVRERLGMEPSVLRPAQLRGHKKVPKLLLAPASCLAVGHIWSLWSP